jgi:hypothetical protein
MIEHAHHFLWHAQDHSIGRHKLGLCCCPPTDYNCILVLHKWRLYFSLKIHR